MDDDIDLFEASSRFEAPPKNTLSGGTQIEISDEEEVELCIEDDAEPEEAETNPADLAPPAPKRRKLDPEPVINIKAPANSFVSARTLKQSSSKDVAQPSAAAVAAASVSSFGLRSFFKTLAPGMSNLPLISVLLTFSQPRFGPRLSRFVCYLNLRCISCR
jgi:hypothetical protein